MRLKNIFLIFCLSAIPFAGSKAARHLAADAAAVAALKNLAPGDTVVMSAGEWRDQAVKLHAVGTENDPVVLTAERPGETILTGSSSLGFSGNYIVVCGLRFRDNALTDDAVVSFRTTSTRFAENSTLRDCVITGDGLEPSRTDYKWVSVYGRNNRVERCTFIDKRNMGTLLVVWLEDGVRAGHTIRGNRFSRPYSHTGDDGKAINGQETIRIGTSAVSMTAAECIVEENYFYLCNGEIETVSNKSCGNIYRGNVFSSCEGTLTLRHGNDCEVYGNAFFGNKVKNTGGIRVIGERHRIYNNYMQDLAGTGYSSAICVVQGEEDPALSGYFAARDCHVVNNTVIDCAWGINLNHGSDRQRVPVANITVANNVVANYADPKAYSFIVRLTPEEPENILWRNNFVFGGRFRDTDARQTASREMDPDLRSFRGFRLPFNRTALTRQTVPGFDFVTRDFLGQPRNVSAVVPGAFEAVGKPDLGGVASQANTGAQWWKN